MEAKISISIKEGKFEISGSEDFVNKQIENFEDLITETVENVEPKQPTGSPNLDSNSNGSSNSTTTNTSTLEEYPYVYVEDGDSIKIVCDLPGNSKSEKTFNAAILYAYALKLKGQDEAPVEDIRDIARNHGCYDGSNFSGYINSGDPQYYLDKDEGTRKSRVIKLNRPGIKEAEKLIQQINENAE